MSVSETMRAIIEEKGLKQSVIARRSGFTPQQFNAMVKGRKIIKACDVMAIAQALEVPVSELFAGTGQK